MFKSALDIIKQSSIKKGVGGFKASSESDNGLFFATHAVKTPGKYPFIFFRIGRELARKAGLAPGDTVLFGIDDETGIAKIYADKHGWKLVSGNTKSDNPPLILRVTWREGFPSIADPAMCKDVIARSRSISFRFPDKTSYNGLAKKSEVKEEEPVDELFEEHKKIAEREERVNKKAVKQAIPLRRESDKAPMMRDGKPYGRRKEDKKPAKRT